MDKYLLALSTFIEYGPQRIKLLIKYFETPKNVWKASEKELTEVGLKTDVVKRFISYRNRIDIEEYLYKLEKKSIKFVSINDESYPANLKEIDTAPPVLYYLGTLIKNDVNAVAIVGSRKATSYGREVAYKFAQELSGYGVTIVSGLALGIDAVAHQAVIDSGGRGIAVIATGLDKITPITNMILGRNLVKNGGAIVSEMPLGVEIFRSSFPIRNRIVSGLSKAVIVIEGLEKSGTLLTASHAADQGRTVFAIPGQITSPMSGAPHFLIKNGAKFAFSPKDVLDDLNLQVSVDREVIEKILPSDKLEEKILTAVENEALHIDEIARLSGIPISDVGSKLTVMQIKGMVKPVGNGEYVKS